MRENEQLSEFLTVEELADRWHTTPAGIHNQRYRGTAPPACRIGKRLLFHRDTVRAFEATRADDVADQPQGAA